MAGTGERNESVSPSDGVVITSLLGTIGAIGAAIVITYHICE